MDIGLSWGNGAVDQSQARRLSSLERLYCKNVISLIREIEILEARLGDNYRAHPEFFDFLLGCHTPQFLPSGKSRTQ